MSEELTCALDGCDVRFKPKRKTQKFCTAAHGRTAQNRRQRIMGTQPAPAVGEEVSEVEILRARVRELESDRRRIRESEVAEERVMQRLENAIHSAPPKFNPLVIPKAAKQAETQELALLFSDTHASETVSSEETEGMNTYDWDTMLQRMNVMQESVLSHQSHLAFPVSTLNVWMLGDMLSGDIHEELEVTNDRPAAEAAVDFAYAAAEWLECFVPHFENVRVRGVPGNHPRAKKKPAAKMAHNNGDWLSYKMMEIYHRENPNIEYKFKRGAYQITKVADRWNVLLMHGDGIRSTMPGVPWGGVVRRITTLEQQFSKAKNPLDYVCLGHFHTANTLDGVQARTFMNGSVKGLDEYSLKQFGSGRDASQLLLSFHPKRGWTGTYPLDLQSSMPASEGWA